MNIFDGLTFDSAAFISYPRCVGSFLDEVNEAGCLLTNFWRALGFNLHIERTYPSEGVVKQEYVFTLNGGSTFNLSEMISSTNTLFDKYLPYLDLPKHYRWRIDNYYEVSMSPVQFITCNYDEIASEYLDDPKSKDAVDLIWQLIDKLPKKVHSDSHENSKEASCSK